MKILIFSLFYLIPQITIGQQIKIANNKVERAFEFDGKVWRTTGFHNKALNQTISVKSEEFSLLPMNSDKALTISDFTIAAVPEAYQRADSSFLVFRYKPLSSVSENLIAPDRLTITYSLKEGESIIRKQILIRYEHLATIDRLEVERLIIGLKQTGGGRGEPVFIDNQLFFGLEYPGGYLRHTDGNSPKSYGRHYDKVGNYSMIDLEGRDIDVNAPKNMLRLMHFPGYAKQNSDRSFQIRSKVAVLGFVDNGLDIEKSFMNYLKTIWKQPRSFLHYNNWFEPKAKNLNGDGLINIYKGFKSAISPYGIKLDAVVPDDGWQNRNSIWDPLPKYFPNGISDVKRLSDKLKAEGTGFGLWLSLNGYVNNINWGVKEGFHEAKPNSYFTKFGRYYSLSSNQYKDTIMLKVPLLAKETNAVYFKHDFNNLSDLSEGNNHPPTDRHGHEANLDAELDILIKTREINPGIYQNLTNWIWFSPWWLQYADALWMLAGDDGTNGNWPEISTRAMASTDRDTYIWRMWGDSNDRPLVPISRLMTHGIIKTSDGRMESPEDTLQDWFEYVLMHYGRGTLLKEWYISPDVMTSDQWKSLCTIHNWAKMHQGSLNNTVFVGGRPDEGNTYGYIGWDGDKGILVARNPSALTKKLIIPFDKSIFFYGKTGLNFQANVVFPYTDAYPQNFISGKQIEIVMPGYSTMAFELSPGKAQKSVEIPKLPVITKELEKENISNLFEVPMDTRSRAEILLIGYPKMPELSINGIGVLPKRISKSKINNFADYAVTGMPSKQARPWTMATYDLSSYVGQKIRVSYKNGNSFQSYLLLERKVKPKKIKEENNHLWSLTNDSRRQTITLINKTSNN